MFIEVNYANRSIGWIEVVCGSMFSGKTEELIRRLRRAQIANQEVRIFKPQLDTRYSTSEIVSHDANTIPSIPVSLSTEILALANQVAVVGIDEAQFFDQNLVHVARTLANQGVRVIIAGLDMDFRGEPFGVMPELLATAEFITKVHAICQVCGSLANYSYRLNQEEKDQIILGEKNAYEPRCRRCYNLGPEARNPENLFEQSVK